MRVAMIGPDLNARGGIASLAGTFVNSQALSGVELRYFGSVGNGSLPRRLAQMAKGQGRFLSALASGWTPDLVHIHVADGGSFFRKWVYLEQARLRGLPVILHNNFAHMETLFERSAAHAAAIRHAYSTATQVHVVSHDMARSIEQWTGGKANIRVLFNPVSAAEFNNPGPRGASDEPVVLYMGYVGDRKGVFDLVDVWPQVVKAVPGARLRLGGDGELDRLRNAVIGKNLQSSVEVMGWIGGDDRLKAFETADLYCLPSYAEGQPVSVLEAMASGLPVLSTNVDGIPDAIDEGDTGLMVTPGDQPALADALIKLLSDPDARDRMGQAGRARVEQVFDSEVVSERLRGFWEEVVRGEQAAA